MFVWVALVAPKGVATSPTKRGLSPLVSVKNILCCIALDVVAVADEFLNLTPSTLVPFAPAVTTVYEAVPEPSDAVFAAVILAGMKLPVSVKIGIVFAGIICYFVIFFCFLYKVIIVK
jgi:hypothetical protein